MKQQFVVDQADTIRVKIYENSVTVTPSAATVTLYKPDGTELQAEDTATVAASGELQYSLTSTHTDDLGLNYKAVWKYTVSSVDYFITQLFDVVRSVLHPTVTDTDIIQELSALRSQGLNMSYAVTGTADSATGTTLVDSERIEPDDDWTGGKIEIFSGTGSGQLRDVTDFVQSTNTLTVDPAWDTNPDGTSKYRLTRSFTAEITRAFERIEFDLSNKGRRAELIIESSQLHEPQLNLALSIVCRSNMREPGDMWDTLSERFKEEYRDMMKNLAVEYDENNTGFISTDERAKNMTQPRLVR